MKSRILYLPFRKKEIWSCAAIGLVYAAAVLLLQPERMALSALIFLLLAGLAIFLTRNFWQESLSNLHLLSKRIFWLPFVAVILHLVFTTFINDILLFYGFPYFVSSDWGPLLWDIQADALAAQKLFWPTAIVLILVLPVLEELVFRQLIFSLLQPIHRGLAIFVSVLLFTALHIIGFWGTPEPLYTVLFAIRYLSMGLFLCWLYCHTDSIFSPVLMHILCNILLVRTACRYLSM